MCYFWALCIWKKRRNYSIFVYLCEENRRGLSISPSASSNAVQSITFNSIHLNFQRAAKEKHLLIMNSERSSSSSRTPARRCALRDSWRWEEYPSTLTLLSVTSLVFSSSTADRIRCARSFIRHGTRRMRTAGVWPATVTHPVPRDWFSVKDI